MIATEIVKLNIAIVKANKKTTIIEYITMLIVITIAIVNFAFIIN